MSQIYEILSSKTTSDFVMILILLNLILVLLESVPSVKRRLGEEVFDILETISVLVFTVEYAARIYTAPVSAKYLYVVVWISSEFDILHSGYVFSNDILHSGYVFSNALPTTPRTQVQEIQFCLILLRYSGFHLDCTVLLDDRVGILSRTWCSSAKRENLNDLTHINGITLSHQWYHSLISMVSLTHINGITHSHHSLIS